MPIFCRNFRQLVALLLSLSLATPVSHAAGQQDGLISRIVDTFSSNGVPDLTDIKQKKAFEFYLKKTFKGQTEIASLWQMSIVQGAIEKINPLPKDLFGSVDVEIEKKYYLASTELKKFIAQQMRTTGNLKSLFLQPSSNLGSWTKLKFEGNDFVRPEHLERLLETVVPKLKSENPLEILTTYEIFFKDCRFPRAATLPLTEGLIYMLSMTETDVLEGLQSPNAHDVITALERQLELRKRFEKLFLELKLTNRSEKNRENVLKAYIPSIEQAEKHLAEFTNNILNSPLRVGKEAFQVRPLSLTESPYRSCLATSDCSTRTYMGRAFDSAFYYFTATEKDKTSKGHVTIALGQAFDEGLAKNIALVDKVQDVPVDRLEVMLEAVRQSVAQKGYTLVFPQRLDDSHNGVSNYKEITARLEKIPSFAMQTKKLHDHKTYATTHGIEAGYSKAFEQGDVTPLLPLNEVLLASPHLTQVAFNVKEPLPQRPANIRLEPEDLLNEVRRLANGSIEDRWVYLELLDTLHSSQMGHGDSFVETLDMWAKDQSLPLRLRNRALRSILTIKPAHLPDMWSHFTPEQIQTLLLSWLEMDRLFLNSEGLYFAVLSALPFLNPNSSNVEKLLDPRILGFDGEVRFHIVKAARNSTKFLQVLKELPNLKNETFLRKLFINLTITVILFEALHEAEVAGDTFTSGLLREAAHKHMNLTIHSLSSMDKNDARSLAKKIAPFLIGEGKKSAFLGYIEGKIDQLKPILLRERLQNLTSFLETSSLVVLTTIITTKFIQIGQAPWQFEATDLKAFLAAAAAAGVSSALKYTSFKQGPGLRSRQKRELETLTTITKTVYKSTSRECAALLSKKTSQ